jgi:hypothetical protein
LLEKAPELPSGKPVREEHVEDLLRPARPPRMPTNLAGRLAEQKEGMKKEG